MKGFWSNWVLGLKAILVLAIVTTIILLPFNIFYLFLENDEFYKIEEIDSMESFVYILLSVVFLFVTPIISYKVLFQWFDGTIEKILKSIGYEKINGGMSEYDSQDTKKD